MVLDVHGELRELALDALAALRGGITLLLEALHVEPQRAELLHLTRMLVAPPRELGQPLGRPALDARRGAARLVDEQRLCAQAALQVLDLVTAREHAFLLGVGGVHADRLPADDVAVGDAELPAPRQRCALRARPFQRFRGEAAGEPFGEKRLHARIGGTDQLRQRAQRRGRFVRIAAGRASGAGQRREEADFRRRCVGRESGDDVEPAHLERTRSRSTDSMALSHPSSICTFS